MVCQKYVEYFVILLFMYKYIFLIGIFFLVLGCMKEAKVKNIELENLYEECVENVLKDDL